MPDSDEKPLVYIVDDEEHITELVAMGLGINDLSPVRLHSSREVLQKIEEQRPDLMILDVMLPELDGFEVARRLRQSEGAGTRIPIIFLTARDATADKVQGLRIGVDDYVTKPFSIEELSERVKAVLRRSTSCAVSCSPIHGESLRESRSSSASGTTRCRPPRSMSTKVTRARVMRLSSQHSTPRGEATVGSSSARKALYVQLGAGGN
jgi:DNA-binding response OmpR family regulator